VERLLQQCPHLRILATSREPLGIAGETRYRVPSLTLPAVGSCDNQQLTTLLAAEAAELFLDRAEAALPAFRVTPENAPILARVCVQLDGMPLAIELAASRVTGMSVESLSARLEERFRLLRVGSRTALPRHQTLRALIDWSYDLLTEPERTLLRRLSVFAGGWTLEAAESVCVDDDGGVRGLAPALESDGKPPHSTIVADEVLDLLTSLVDKSLVQYEEPGGEARYRLLETVRQYARERLEAAGETDHIRERHLAFFLDLAEAAEPRLTATDSVPWLDRLEREHGNLRAALAWTLENGAAEAGQRLASAVQYFWMFRGYWREGREHLARVLALPGAAVSPRVRAKALFQAGAMAFHQGDFGVTRVLVEESVAIRRALGDRLEIGWSLNPLGIVAREQGDLAASRALFEEGLAITREALSLDRVAINLYRVAMMLSNLGHTLVWQGDFEAARAAFEESLPLAREAGSRNIIAQTLCRLGSLARYQGDFATARARCEEGLAAAREFGSPREMAWALHDMGKLACCEGDYAAARAQCGEALAIRQKLGERRWIPQCLEGLAWAAGGEGQLTRAARLLGAAEALREKHGTPPAPLERADYASSLSAARSGLGDEAFAAAWAEGREMTLEEAVRAALAEG
jgi:non-specific serine/threonine protein kinase